MAVLREMTKLPPIRDRSAVKSPVIPSAKYCCSGLSLRLVKGSTTIDRRGTFKGAVGADADAVMTAGCGFDHGHGHSHHPPPAATSTPARATAATDRRALCRAAGRGASWVSVLCTTGI